MTPNPIYRQTERPYATISIDIETYRKLTELAEENDRSIAWVIRSMVNKEASK